MGNMVERLIRIAIPVAAALGAFVAIALWAADRQLSDAHERAQQSEAIAVARAFSSQLGPKDIDSAARLRDPLAALERDVAELRAAAIVREGDEGQPVVVGLAGRLNPDAWALGPVNDGRPRFRPQRGSPDLADLTFPLVDSSGRAVAALVLAHDFTAGGSALEERRHAMALSVVGGAALLFLLLCGALGVGRAAASARAPVPAVAPVAGPEPQAAPVPVPTHDETALPLGAVTAPASELDPTLGALDDVPYDDPVTGLLSERGFREELRLELARAEDEGYRVTVCALELDGSERFGTERGGPAHLDALRLVAAQIVAELYAGELCGRHGERFMLALGRVGGSRAEDLVHRIQSAVGALVLVPADEPLTLAVGMAQFPYDGTEAGELLHLAGRALEESMSAGAGRQTAYLVESDS